MHTYNYRVDDVCLDYVCYLSRQDRPLHGARPRGGRVQVPGHHRWIFKCHGCICLMCMDMFICIIMYLFFLLHLSKLVITDGIGTPDPNPKQLSLLSLI